MLVINPEQLGKWQWLHWLLVFMLDLHQWARVSASSLARHASTRYNHPTLPLQLFSKRNYAKIATLPLSTQFIYYEGAAYVGWVGKATKYFLNGNVSKIIIALLDIV